VYPVQAPHFRYVWGHAHCSGQFQVEPIGATKDRATRRNKDRICTTGDFVPAGSPDNKNLKDRISGRQALYCDRFAVGFGAQTCRE
jgi:hypothetical protein